MADQLTLSMELRDDATLSSYIPGANQQAFYAVCHLVRDHGERFIYLWGETGVGISHLLQAACQAASDQQQHAVYLPLDKMKPLHPSMFQGLSSVDLVCIDNVEIISGNAECEESLFCLFNELRDQGKRLLIGASCSPKALSIQLADLKSRLSWGVTYQLRPLEDEDKLAAIQLRAHARGMEITDPVGRFMIRRCERNMNDLFDKLNLLDRESLKEKRKITVPFVKEVLAI